MNRLRPDVFRWLAKISCFLALAFAHAPAAQAIVRSSTALDSHLYTPQNVDRQKFFWKQIFQRYPSSAQVIHDVHQPDLMIDVIDIDQMTARKQGKDRRALKRLLTKRYIKRYQKAVDRFKRYKEKAVRFGAIEQRLLSVYQRSPKDKRRLFAGKVKLRSQGGLADTFVQAANRAQEYLHFMENIFERHRVPKRITRVAFVESMFNTRVRSRVGASGLWQFMPATGKEFLYITPWIDERNAPLKATRGAAKLLRKNFEELKAWPLAITAYNHGRGGMSRAVRRLKTRDISQVIDQYTSPSFGFASKNFYAEYLAAAETYDLLVKNRKVKTRRKNLATISVPMYKRVSLSQLMRYTPLDQKLIEKHNPCLKPKSFSKYKYRYLPPLYEIKIPKTLVTPFRTALKRIRGRKYGSKGSPWRS